MEDNLDDLIEENHRLSQALDEQFEIKKAEIEMLKTFERQCNISDVAIRSISQAMLQRPNEEILVQMGQSESPLFYDARRRVIEACLESQSPVVRHAATEAISLMDSPFSLPAMQKAYQAESAEWVKRYMGAVLARLQEISAK